MDSLNSSSCRLCLNNPPVDSLVFSVSDTFQGRVLQHLIAELFAIQILDDDRLLSVCLECVNRINTVYKIKRLFVENDRKLQGLVRNDPIPNDTLEEVAVYTILASSTSSSPRTKNETLPLDTLESGGIVKTASKWIEDRSDVSQLQISATTDGIMAASIEQEEFEESCELHSDSDSKEEPYGNCTAEENDTDIHRTPTMKLPKHKCYFCAVVFPGSLEFTQHLPDHFVQLPYTCLECDGLVLKTVREASKHIGYHDVKERPFKCRVCTLRFPTRVNSLAHERKMHRFKQKRLQMIASTEESSNQSWTAVENGKTRGQRKDKEPKRAVAVPVPLHECEMCSKKFTAKKNLTRHLMIHTGEKPFKCDQCERSYRQAGELKTHRQIHHSAKVHKCNPSDRRYRSPPTLARHRKGAHPAKPSRARKITQ